jgi:hypothetical protein
MCYFDAEVGGYAPTLPDGLVLLSILHLLEAARQRVNIPSHEHVVNSADLKGSFKYLRCIQTLGIVVPALA